MFKSDYAKRVYTLLSMYIKSGNPINSKLSMQIDPDASKELEYVRDIFESFSTDQAVAVGKVLFGTENILTISGKAGVGKTYFIISLREILSNLFLTNFICCATTGLASQNCQGAGTIHSVFGVGKGNKLPWLEEETTDDKYKYPRNNAHKVATQLLGSPNSPFSKSSFNRKLPTIIVLDEVSMASSELLHICYQIALYIHGAEYNKQKAAENIKFICLGDVMQLLPVNPYVDKDGKRKKNLFTREIVSLPWQPANWNLGDNGYHKENSLLLEGYKDFPFSTSRYSLLTNHRQNDSEFIDALNYIRLGGKINEGPARILLNRLSSKVEPPETEDSIHVYYSNNEAFERNQVILDSKPEKEKEIFPAKVSYTPPKKAGVSGIVINKKKQGKKSYLTIRNKVDGETDIPSEWIPDWANPFEEVAIGLPFMVRQNIPDSNLYNGTVGIIKEFTSNGILIEVEGGREVEVTPRSCNGVDKSYEGKPIGEYIGLPGHLCCGITGHKAQGLTIKKPYVVHINPQHRKYASPHWMYVVLSRVTSMDLLYIDGSVSVINDYIKIEHSALGFAEESELNMQRECEGKILADTFTPDKVKNSIPVLVSVDESRNESENLIIFRFKTYIELDESICFTASYSSLEEKIISYYDEDIQQTFEPNKFEYHSHCEGLINEYLYSYNKKDDLLEEEQ